MSFSDKNKHIYCLNDFSKRLVFIRQKLKLQLIEVEQETGISTSTLHDWEHGRSTSQYSNIYLLSIFYNDLWQERFKKDYPMYDDWRVANITFEFLLLGKLSNIESFSAAYGYIMDQVDEAQEQLNQLKKSLSNQMDLFSK